jgi:putative DNA primase/helicase
VKAVSKDGGGVSIPTAAEIKQAARGQEVEILNVVAGIPREFLTDKEGPCPWCGGNTRARLVDRSAGAFRCSHCLPNKCGDFIAVVQHAKKCDFPTALAAISDYLGLRADSTSLGEYLPDPITAIALAKNTPRESLIAYGAKALLDSITVPMFGPDGRQCSGFRIWVKGTASQRKGRNDHGKPSGLFLPVNADGSPRLPQAGETWLMVEGVKDAAALHARGHLAAGLPTNEMNVKFAELFRGVNVIIVPDLDAESQSKAHKTAKRLKGIALSVRIARLPGEVTAKSGADLRDVLKMDGGETLLQKAIEGAELFDKDDDLIKQLSDEICNTDNFARNTDNRLYYYKDGCYRPGGESRIKKLVKWHCVKNGDTWSSRLASEVVEYISVDAIELWPRPPLDLVNVKNGILRLTDGTLLPHSFDHLSPIQLPVVYDPAATCPAIDKFNAEVFPADALDLAYMITALMLVPNPTIQKAILLLGPGGNGKSAFLKYNENFIGRKNISALSLHRIESDRFSAARLVGKLANICADLPSEHLAGTSTFKGLTGGDSMPAENKFHDSFVFEPFARLIFSANSPPRSKDASQGFFDRWLVVPFPNSFRGESYEIGRGELDASLSTPAELSGLLSKAMGAWRTLRSAGRLPEPESVKAAWREFHAMTDPLAVWLDRHTVDDPDSFVPTQVIRAAYGAECERAGRPALTKSAWGIAIRQHRPDIEAKQRTVNGRVQWCYLGLGMQSDSSDASRDSQTSRTSNTLSYARESVGVIDSDGDSREKLIERESVKSVRSVNDSTCTHSDWIDSPSTDRLGWMTTHCRACGKLIGHRPMETPAAA